MALTWSFPRINERLRIALGFGSTGTDPATAGAADGIDLRDLSFVRVHVEDSAKASGMITFAGIKPGDTVTVNGTVFTAVDRNTVPSAVQFQTGTDASAKPNGASDFIAARNLAAAINASGLAATLTASAVFDGGIVNLQAVAVGAGGNALTLATSSARAVLSGATFAGGITAGAGFTAAGAIQFSLWDPVQQVWNREPALDVVLVTGAHSQALPVVDVKVGPHARMQAAPAGVGVPVNIYLEGVPARMFR